MRAICVEDDPRQLERTVALCRELPRLAEARGFARAGEALAWLADHAADVAILDIGLPDMNGIDLAAAIRERYPDMPILFLTGHAGFAVEAFAIHATGYMLKPVSPERLAAEVDYALSGRRLPRAARVSVQTFGDFQVLVDGRPVVFRRSRAKELLAYLVDRQGRSVTRAQVFAALWENGAYDRSMQKQLDVILRSLRATLRAYGVEEILEVRSGHLRVCPELLDCDLYRFLNGESGAVNAYRGEYMSAYSWAELTEGYMTRNRRGDL